MGIKCEVQSVEGQSVPLVLSTPKIWDRGFALVRTGMIIVIVIITLILVPTILETPGGRVHRSP